jgi:hypothetical protein
MYAAPEREQLKQRWEGERMLTGAHDGDDASQYYAML